MNPRARVMQRLETRLRSGHWPFVVMFAGMVLTLWQLDRLRAFFFSPKAKEIEVQNFRVLPDFNPRFQDVTGEILNKSSKPMRGAELLVTATDSTDGKRRVDGPGVVLSERIPLELDVPPGEKRTFLYFIEASAPAAKNGELLWGHRVEWVR